jgi:NADH:ubiquinone oxidoreductase subunit E
MPGANGRVPGVEARAGKFPGPSLIPALHAIQREHGWLPRERLVALARDTRRPLYEIEGLVSFYPHFRTAPAEGVEVAVCRDLSCRLARTQAEIPEGTVVHEVSCVGRCDRAPVAVVGERYPDAVTGGARRPNDPYPSADDHYGVLRSFTGDPVAVIDESGLRGMGGAGFPTGRKWDMVRGQPGEPKYVICNADEAEPGTFKDRQILAEQPHLVIEGMLIAMRAVGAELGWVFIRHEYEPEERVIRAEIERARAAGVLDGADIDVFTSPGGYILGEETALIECMEGHRGEPRNKPPFPGGYGLHGKPTLMNNVETFAAVPIILERGAEWWKGQGVNGGTGLKFFSVSGHVEAPGDRAGRRRARRRRRRGGPAGRRVDQLPRAGLPRPAAHVRRRGRRRVRARDRRDGRAGRGDRPAGRRDRRPRLLPQRVVRQVRPLPRRHAQGARDPR